MTKAYVKYVISLLIFGSNGVVASYILLSSSQIVLARTVIGSLFLGLVFMLGRQRPDFEQIKKQWRYLLGSGISLGLSWVFVYEAYRLIGVSTATLSYYCGPVIVLAVAPFIFQEKMTVSKLTGISLVVLGMVLVNGADFLTEGMSWGLLCGLMAALFYAAMIIANKKIAQLTGLEITLVSLVTASAVVAPYALLLHRGTQAVALAGPNLIPILIIGVVNTGIACYLYFAAVHELPAQSVAMCSYIEPLSALVFSALMLNEHLTMVQILGATFILGGAVFSELYPFKKEQKLNTAG